MKKLISLILLFVSVNAVAGPSDSALYQKQWLKWRMKVPFWMDNGAYLNNASRSSRTNGDTVLTLNPLTQKIETKIITSGSTPTLWEVTHKGDSTDQVLDVPGIQNTTGDLNISSVSSIIFNDDNGEYTFNDGSSNYGTLNFTALTTSRNISFQDRSGQVALNGDSWDLAGSTMLDGKFFGTSNDRGFGFRTNSIQGMYLDSLNRLGIGMKPSFLSEKLQVSGGIYSDGTITVTNLSSATDADSVVMVDNMGLLKKRPYSVFSGGSWSTSGNTFSNGQYLGTNNNRGFGIRTNGVQAAYVDSMPRGARIGIGQNPLSNDTSRLQVKGGVLIDTMLRIYKTSSGMTYSGKVITSGTSAHVFTSSSVSRTTGHRNTILLGDTWDASSGSSEFTSMFIQPFIVPSGTASGVQRGIYISPTGMTSTTKYRSLEIETSNTGSNWGIYQSTPKLRNWFGGKVGIGSGKSSPVYGLDINCRVGINQDSLPAGASTDSVVMIRTSTNQLTKRAASSFGSSYTAGRGLTLNSNVFRLDTTKDYVWTANNTFSTSVTTPLIVGGTSTTSDLYFKTTTGVGTTGADMHFLVGNNGATEAMTILNDGIVRTNGYEISAQRFRISNGAGTYYGYLRASVNGVLELTNNSEGTLVRLVLGSRFSATDPALKVNGTGIQLVGGTDAGAARMLLSQGTDAASASTLTLTGGNSFEITGTTSVTLITSTEWIEGSVITLIANENVTITNGTATSGAGVTIKLAGASNFSMTADDTLTLMLSSTTAGGIAWREVSRSVN